MQKYLFKNYPTLIYKNDQIKARISKCIPASIEHDIGIKACKQTFQKFCNLKLTYIKEV